MKQTYETQAPAGVNSIQIRHQAPLPRPLHRPLLLRPGRLRQYAIGYWTHPHSRPGGTFVTGKREAVSILIGLFVLTACGGTQGGGGGTTAASVAIVPGGPHPYFEPMRGAIADATTDFKLTKGSFEVPTDWKQDLQNQLL